MHITLFLVIVSVLTTNTLHAAHRPAYQTNRRVAWHSPTLLTHQRFIYYSAPQTSCRAPGAAGQPIDPGVLQRHAAIELRHDLRMAIVRTPAGRCVLQRILVGKVRQRWDTEHVEESAVFRLFYARA